ncbi:MAG: glycosyltransferase family 2 protein [Chloroflexota bacterium]
MKFNQYKPLISVIQPVFNAAHCLERSIQSVVTQTYENIQYIIIDGGSTDGTLDIIRKYEDKIDFWISRPDEGVYDAMNKGVEIANGDWLYFLGADDVLVNILHRVVPCLRKINTVYYGDVYWPNQNRVYDGKFQWNKLMNKNICHQAIFYPREVFIYYRYDLAYFTCADYALNLRLWGDRRFKFEYIPLLICIFQDRAGKSRLEMDKKFQKDKEYIVQLVFSNEMHRRNLRLFVQEVLVSVLNKLGIKDIVKRTLMQ